MRRICYVIGAGLTKALERDREHRVPLMWDFVSVLADHIASDVVLTTLVTLEIAEAFEYSLPAWKAMAKALTKYSPREAREAYAAIVRRRPAENIEKLLQAAHARRHTDIYADTVPARFSFAINDVFSRVGWNVRMNLLTEFLRQQFAMPETAHTFIDYNYDLVLDASVAKAAEARWNPVAGYGVPFRYVLHVDETADHMRQFRGSGGAYELLAPHLAPNVRTTDIQILKPHGSLNWAAEFTGNYDFTDRDPLLILRPDATIGYYPPFDALQVEGTELGETGFDAALYVVPPRDTPSGDAEGVFLQRVTQAYREALASADDIVIIGWSMPSTDKGEVANIARVLATRTAQPCVLVANLHADVSYFRRVAELCNVPLDRLTIFNDGFEDFVRTVQF